nr:hypothetical protein [uncultured Flavobacterium sp.]
MELEKLQDKGIENFIFKKKIKQEEEKLFIMRYQVLTKSINGLTESFIVNFQRLKELLLENGSKSYCNFYYIQNDNMLNLGLSFSDNGEEPIQESDALYILQNELFITTDYANFNKLINTFKNDIGKNIKAKTKLETNMISYDFENVDYYLKTLDFHFPVNFLKFNMFQYRSTNLNDEILINFEGKNNKISFCVHAIFGNTDKLFGESNGYDLGNLMP